jgi:hypothetical protein
MTGVEAFVYGPMVSLAPVILIYGVLLAYCAYWFVFEFDKEG